MKNLQISDNDLMGNKFNGHDLHLYLREKKINSIQLVLSKESNDPNTFELGRERENWWKFKSYTKILQREYSLDPTIMNPFIFDLLYSKQFLDSDVVHFHLVHNDIIDIQLLPIMSSLKPIVWTIHDPWSLGGHCIHHFDCMKWQKTCGDCPYLLKPFAIKSDNSSLNLRIKRDAIKNSKINLIVASNWMMKKIKQSPTFKGKRIHLIPFGINQDIFHPIDKYETRGKLGIPRNAFVISIRADKSPFKGMDYIDYALENIVTDKKVYILAAGFKLGKKYKNFTVKEFGWIHNDQLLAEIYNASDLFLMPSLMETFGMMAIEAMSCGTVPVVLNGTALPETVNSPKCGIATKINKTSYANMIQYLIDNPNVIQSHSVECLKYAKNHYSKERYISSVIKVYQDAIKAHRTSKEDTFLLSQLKKHMMIDTSLSASKSMNFNKVNPYSVKAKILVILFKLDKVVPKSIRTNIKTILSKIKFI